MRLSDLLGAEVLDQADVVDAAGGATRLVEDLGAEQLTQAHSRLRAGGR